MRTDDRVMQVLAEAKKLAKQYYGLTGKPLGITGEVAEYEAARLLGITLTPARQNGHDAIEKANRSTKKLQIKGRCLQANCKPGQRLGGIQLKKEWDAVLMVLLDENFDATEIYEADRSSIERALIAPGSLARNERGQLGVSKFKSIAKRRWPGAKKPKRIQNNGDGIGRWCVEQIRTTQKSNGEIASEARRASNTN